MSEPVISARGLSKAYTVARAGSRPTTLAEAVVMCLTKPFARFRSETFWALRDVSFDLRAGEVLGVIGPNGAGKSTLLKILSRITEPTRGEADLHGRVGSLLEVGTGFHPELTGRENIFLNGAILGMRRRDIARQFDSIVEFAGTEAFLDMPVKRYSSGMFVRLAFAVAAHLSPDILIVDEVLAVGDLAFQRKCLDKMSEVAGREGRTVIFVSHNMAAVRKLCTRGLLLCGGAVGLEGKTDDVVAKYLALNAEAASATTELPLGDSHAAARALSVRTLRADGTPAAQFHIGEAWRIRVEFEVRRALPHVIAAAGLRNVEGFPLVTWWSAPSDLEPGKYFAEFTCELPLSAGDLNFTIGVSTHEHTVYYVEGVGAVAISEVALGEQPLRASGAGVLVTTQQPPIQPLP
jgi:lipopolysaccharide transport system ATP-binding protein